MKFTKFMAVMMTATFMTAGASAETEEERKAVLDHHKNAIEYQHQDAEKFGSSSGDVAAKVGELARKVYGSAAQNCDHLKSERDLGAFTKCVQSMVRGSDPKVKAAAKVACKGVCTSNFLSRTCKKDIVRDACGMFCCAVDEGSVKNCLKKNGGKTCRDYLK